MTNGGFLSVIIPTYNYAHLLSRCLRSVLSQLNPSCEVLVINDGSTDDTNAVLTEIESKFPNTFKVIQQENAGAAAARNRGMLFSSGKYILFLDADDELTPGTLTVITELLCTKPDLDLLIGAHLACYPDGKEKLHLPGILRSSPRDKAEDYLIRKKVSIGHGAMVVKKSLLESRPYPEKFRKSEDIPVFAHMITNGKVGCIDHVMARINKHPTSLRHTQSKKLEDYRKFVDEVFKTLPSECANLMQRYSAQRCLSLFRSAAGSHHYDLARVYFRQAVALDFRQALKLSYIRKAIRVWLK